MSVSKPYNFPGAPLVIDGAGLEVSVERPHEVCLVVEHADYSGWSGPLTAERFVEVSAEDWDAIVAHVNAERARLAEGASSTGSER